MRLIKYILRWQLSTPILTVCVLVIPGSTLVKTVIANLIGALIFYKVDKWIFKKSGYKDS